VTFRLLDEVKRQLFRLHGQAPVFRERTPCSLCSRWLSACLDGGDVDPTRSVGDCAICGSVSFASSVSAKCSHQAIRRLLRSIERNGLDILLGRGAALAAISAFVSQLRQRREQSSRRLSAEACRDVIGAALSHRRNTRHERRHRYRAYGRYRRWLHGDHDCETWSSRSVRPAQARKSGQGRTGLCAAPPGQLTQALRTPSCRADRACPVRAKPVRADASVDGRSDEVLQARCEDRPYRARISSGANG